MSKSFSIDTFVVYGKTGVCKIVERKLMDISKPPKEYYVLSPVADPRSAVYVPCDNEALVSKLRPLLTKEEIDDCLTQAGGMSLDWPEDKAERQLVFRELMGENNPVQLLRLIRCLYVKRQEKQTAGKRLSSADEALLQDAIRLLEEEFAFSLGVARNQVADYIRCHFENI